MRYLLTSLLCVLLISCNKYEDGPAFSLIRAEVRLCGEWEVVSINPDPLWDWFDIGVIWKFDQNGYFRFSSTFQETIVHGEWEFESNKEDLEINLNENEWGWVFGSLYPSGLYKINGLTNKQLLILNELGTELKLKKID